MYYRYNYSINSKWGYWLNSNDIVIFIAYNGSVVLPVCFSTSFMKRMLSSFVFLPIKEWYFKVVLICIS